MASLSETIHLPTCPPLAATLPTFSRAISPAALQGSPAAAGTALLQAQHTRHHPHGSLVKTHKKGKKSSHQLTSAILPDFPGDPSPPFNPSQPTLTSNPA